jgi:hypothetical protein
MKKSVIILTILLAATFIPKIEFPKWDEKETGFEFDYLSNEGYIAYVVNSTEYKEPETPKSECECKGTGTITHGDGHKTPCPYVNPATGKCEFGKEVKTETPEVIIQDPVYPQPEPEEDKKKVTTVPFPPVQTEKLEMKPRARMLPRQLRFDR